MSIRNALMVDLAAFLPVLLAMGVLAWIGLMLARLGGDGSDGADGGNRDTSWRRGPDPTGPLPSAGPDDLARSA